MQPKALFFEPTPGRRTVHIALCTSHGAAADPQGLGGATHFVEHLCLRSCGGRDRLEMAALIDRLGGGADAWTANELMGLDLATTIEAFDEAAALAVDALMSPTFEAEDVELERSVILAELELYDDDPDSLVAEAVLEAAWGTHPMSRPIAGRAETVEKLSADTLRSHHQHLLEPGRLALSVVGDLEPERVAAAFAALPLAEAPGFSALPPASFRADRRHLAKLGTEQIYSRWAFPGLGRGDLRLPALGLLERILGGGTSSRLFQRLREGEGLAYDIGSSLMISAAGGLIEVAWTCSPRSAADVARISAEEIERLHRKGPSSDELETARLSAIRGLDLDWEDPGSRAAMSISEAFRRQCSLDIARARERLEAVTLADVAALASELLDPEARAEAVCGPESALGCGA